VIAAAAVLALAALIFMFVTKQIRLPARKLAAIMSGMARFVQILIVELELVAKRMEIARILLIFCVFLQTFSTDTGPNARLLAAKVRASPVRFVRWIAFASADSHTKNARTLTMMDAAISRGS